MERLTILVMRVRTTLVGGGKMERRVLVLNGASGGRRCRGEVSDIERRMSSWGSLDASDDILGHRLERRGFMDGGACANHGSGGLPSGRCSNGDLKLKFCPYTIRRRLCGFVDISCMGSATQAVVWTFLRPRGIMVIFSAAYIQDCAGE